MIKEFLKKIGLDEQTIAALTADEKPEDFNLADAVTSFAANQEEIFFAKHKKAIIDDALKDEGKNMKKAVVNSWKQKLKSTFALDTGEKSIKDMEFDDIVSLVNEKVNVQSASNDEELKGKLSDITKKYGALQEKVIDYKNKINEKEQAFDTFKVEYDTRFKVNRLIDTGLNAVEWADSGDLLSWQKNNLKKEYENRYSINADGVPVLKDGTPVLRPNNGGVYKHINEIINDDVDRLKLRKLSNGGDRRDPSVVVQNVNGKNVDRSRSSELARQLGFE